MIAVVISLVLSLFILPRAVCAYTLDIYGGLNQIVCPTTGSATHFYTQKVGNRWWICDPLGHGFYIMGITLISFSQNANQQNNIITKYNSVANPNWSEVATYWAANWEKTVQARMTAWGFNDLADGQYGNMIPTAVDGRWIAGDHTPAYKTAFNTGAHLSSYAMQNTQGCGQTSAIKDLMGAVGATYNQFTYNTPDWYDPGFTNCVTNVLNTTNNPNGLYQGLGTASGFTNANNEASYYVYATLDEGDQTGFLGAGPDYPTENADGTLAGVQASQDGAWVVLSSSPSIAKAPVHGFSDQTYSIQENYSKVKFANLLATKYLCTAAGTPLACCTGNQTGTCSVDPNAGAGVAITGANMTTAKNALNTAWGSSFTTLSTSDSNCSANLATCLGSGGSPTYNSWAAANCKASGEPLSCCTAAGVGATCGTKGTGLLDEDGSDQFMGDACNLKTSSDPQACLSGRTTAETASMQSDLENLLLKNYATQYFSVTTAALSADAPGILMQMQLGGFGTPARGVVLQVGCQYLTLPQMTLWASSSDVQSRYDFNVTNCGDHPWMYWEGFPAGLDSSESSHGADVFSTQAARGAAYTTMAQKLVSLKGTADSEYHGVGFYWWAWEDQDSEGRNWGLLTAQHDNAYDSVESVTATVSCAAPDAGFGSCGGEAGNYGDFVDYVTMANKAALTSLTTQVNTPSGSPRGLNMW